MKKTIPLIASIICVILAASFVGVITNYSSDIKTKDDTITTQQDTIDSLNQQIADRNAQIQQSNQTISTLNQQLQASKTELKNQTQQTTTQTDNNANLLSQIADLQSQITNQQNTINNQNEIINRAKNEQPTYIFHVCEKGEGYAWGHLPNATDTYNQILTIDNNTHSILLLPEYKGHQNWTEELSWIASNFGGKNGIPIMLDIFGGGDGASPTPMLTTNQISQAMAVANVQALRIAEVISWHSEHNQTFPIDYVTNLLSFSKTNNLKLLWTEWKIDSFATIKIYTQGYEDIVTVSFSTNSNDLQPTEGFLYLNGMFQQWSASIQAWYWETHYNSSLMNMPPSLLLEHTLSAEGLGAKTIQFEPYWYFFDNGQPNDNLKLLFTPNA